MKTNSAHFAAGCFWGVEYYFEKLQGVKYVLSGYMGGLTINPTYEDICSGTTGHYEAVEILYDLSIISFEKLVKYFFEIHNFEQTNGQGPDIGSQYLSVAFFKNENEKKIIEQSIKKLKNDGYDVATKVLANTPFYKAEDYHQGYYRQKNQKPYCHFYSPKF